MAGVGSQVFRYFREKGLTPQQAAGIVGNTQQESSNNPNAPGGGLIQGQGGRTSSGSLSQQLNGIWGELQGPERGTLQALKGAKNAREAALIFSKRFERPGEPMNNKRVQYAEEALKSFGGINPGPQARPASQASTGTSQGESGSSGVDPQVIAALLSKSQGQESGPAPVQLQQTPAYPGANIGPKVVQGSAAQKEPAINPALAALLSQSSEGKSESPHAVAGEKTPSKLPGGTPLAKGLAHFQGKPVAAWIAPALEYAKAHGWKGSVTSGYRSTAEQERIYNSGVRPAAKPGTSNHEGTEFPRGAVDVSEAQQLAQILQNSPFAQKLVYAGSKDPVHFSHPHNGSY